MSEVLKIYNEFRLFLKKNTEKVKIAVIRRFANLIYVCFSKKKEKEKVKIAVIRRSLTLNAYLK